MTVRLSRNNDKGRGFVNGAIGVIQEVLAPSVFVVKLISNEALVLVHPMVDGHKDRSNHFVPCCYGYATTIRRAQGSTLSYGCLWFGARVGPATRGYGYVGVSRFKKRSGVYIFGQLRRTDFLPVRVPDGDYSDEVRHRSELSESDEEDMGGLHGFLVEVFSLLSHVWKGSVYLCQFTRLPLPVDS